ncbi:MAG: AEC family transporter [Actinomycetota bacterium]
MAFDPTLAVKLVPLYLLVAAGFVLGRVFKVDSRDLGKLALYLLSPAVVFKGFYGARLDTALVALPLAVFALASVAALLAHKGAARLWSDGRERIAAFTVATGNTGFFGIPACLSLVGPEALPVAVLVSFGATAYENTVGFYVVARHGAGVAAALMRVARYPGLHACWLGALLNATHTAVPVPVSQAVELLAAAYVPVGMMIVGLGLAAVKRLRLDLGFTAFAFACKFLAWPLLALAVVRLLPGLDLTTQRVLMVEALTPLAAVTVVHATLNDIHPDRAAVAVAASTLFALVWLPVVYGALW